MENRQELVQNIVKALASSLNPSNDIRKQAEAFIKQVKAHSISLYLNVGREDPRLRLFPPANLS